MLRLNSSVIAAWISSFLDSNTTNVKVKRLLPAVTDANGENSNTTNVKVKQLRFSCVFYLHIYSNTTNVKVKLYLLAVLY